MTEESGTLERQRAVLIRAGYGALIVLGIIGSIKYLLPVLWPFAVALVLAGILNRPVTWLRQKLHLPRGISAAGLTLGLFILFVGALAYGGTGIFVGIENLLKKFPETFNLYLLPLVEQMFQWLENGIYSLNLEIGAALSAVNDTVFSYLSAGVLRLCSFFLGALSSTIVRIPAVFMKLMITWIATIFITVDYQKIMHFLVAFTPKRLRPLLGECKKFFGRTVPRCIFSYVLIFLLTGAELFIGLSLLGIENSFTVALVIALLDILPVLGTGTILIPWALLSILQGKSVFGLLIMTMYLVITVIRNMVEPKLVGIQIKLHPVLTFASMLIGLNFFGVIGMFGLPLGLSFLRHLHDSGMIHISALDCEETT